MNQFEKPAHLAPVFMCLMFLAAVGSSPQDTGNSAARSAKSSGEPQKKTNEEEGSHMRLTTYLLFDGTCKDAMTFYHAVFGGDLTMTTVGESPMKNAFPASMHEKIVNAELKSDLVDISASDWLSPSEKPIRGNTVCLFLSRGTPGETRTLFEKLSENADISDPLIDQPFGLYGALNDKFGNRWMFHSEKQ